jgi:hypothetical protein
MENLPKDPIRHLNFINKKLRDIYSSLDALCDDLNVDRAELEEKLKGAGYEYSEEHKKFW